MNSISSCYTERFCMQCLKPNTSTELPLLISASFRMGYASKCQTQPRIVQFPIKTDQVERQNMPLNAYLQVFTKDMFIPWYYLLSLSMSDRLMSSS